MQTERVTFLTTPVAKLAEADGDLRDRVSRPESVIEGAAMATTRQRRIEE
jgi:hypothetical protein